MKRCPKCETPWDNTKRYCPFHGLLLVFVPDAPTTPPAKGSTGELTESEKKDMLGVPPGDGRPLPANLFYNQSPEESARQRQPDVLSNSSANVRSFFEDETPTARSKRPKQWPPQETATPTEGVPAIESGDIQSAATGPVNNPPTARPENPKTEVRYNDETIVGYIGEPILPPPTPPKRATLEGNAFDNDAIFLFDTEDEPEPQKPVTPAYPATQPEIIGRETIEPGRSTVPPPDKHLTPSSLPSIFDDFPEEEGPQLSQAQYFRLFNDRKKLIQQFVEMLASQGFGVGENYINRDDCMMHQFDVAFRHQGATFTFPITVMLKRKPTYSVLLSIDLYDIGQSPQLRQQRAVAIGGKSELTPNGTVYFLPCPERLPNEKLPEWLDTAFRAVLKAGFNV